jgi:hypothetical protein
MITLANPNRYDAITKGGAPLNLINMDDDDTAAIAVIKANRGDSIFIFKK